MHERITTIIIFLPHSRKTDLGSGMKYVLADNTSAYGLALKPSTIIIGKY